MKNKKTRRNSLVFLLSFLFLSKINKANRLEKRKRGLPNGQNW